MADFTVSGAQVMIEDDDARGVTLSRTRLGIAEGASGTYTAVLASEPTAPVTVTPSRRSGDTDVTVSAAGDADAVDDTAVLGHAVSGGTTGRCLRRRLR